MNITISKEDMLNLVMGLSKSNRKWLAERLMESVELEDANPSPSKDPYFDNVDNINTILQAEKEIKDGKGVVMTIDQIQKELGL